MEVAFSAARWVVGKALAPVADGLLEAWASSKDLGPNVEALKLELLYAQGMLNNTRGREIDNLALNQLLHKLRALAYGAEDVLDELDYFRIQDELERTHEASDDMGANGLICGPARHACNAAKFTALQLCGSCSRTASPDDHEEEEEEQGDAKPGAVICCCCNTQTARGEDKQAGGGMMRRITSSGARLTARAVGKFFPCCSLPRAGSSMTGMDSTKLNFRRVEISKRMKDIVDELKPLCAKVSTIINLDLLDSNRSIVHDIAAALLRDPGYTPFAPKSIAKTRPMTTSEISETKFFGRQKETAKIIHDITNGDYSGNDLTVLPIVGLGGMGKTTLAQHIYKEAEKYFGVKIWICVSVNFSVGRLTKEIAEAIPTVQHEESHTPDDKLIEQRLKHKKFLLVLDDMWDCGDEEEWNRLLSPLKKTQTKGNIILVTTRSPALAQMVKSKTTDTVELKGLDDESFWNLFMSSVFDNEESKNKLLLDIGREIVKKLKGNPLAAKTVGRLLRNHLDADHWERVLKSKQWELQSGDHDIMPALKLSYDYLPFHLQQCFYYCSLFPEDYKFLREELIHWWTGLDIIHSDDSQNKSIEDIGLQYLKDLEDHGFFKEDKTYANPVYVIHDLLHDLGVKVASRECLSIDRANMGSMEIWPSVRHLSIIVDGADDSDGIITGINLSELRKLKKKLKIENLQTLMIFGNWDEKLNSFFVELIKQANGLRVLHLSQMIPHMEISALHLRYLSVGMPEYRKEMHLPSMLSRLYLLRILNLRAWASLSLPKDMGNLTKLRHFLTYYDEDHSKICNVGKVHFLQELKRFEVNKQSSGFELKQLENLVELRELGIYNLEKVQTKEEAADAQLIEKIYLHKLTLNWHIGVPRNQRDVEGVVLERLQPGRNLQELCIRGHGCRSCPKWLGSNLSVKALQSLHLEGVDWEDFPWLGHMSVLHELALENMSAVKEFGPNHFGGIKEQSFRNLKELKLVGLKGLEKWNLGDTSHLFSQLQVLIIRDCPELLELPFAEHICYPPRQDEEGKIHCWFPKLQELVLVKCPKVVMFPPIPWTKTLHSVDINDVGPLLLGRLKYSTLYSGISLAITGNDELHTLDEVLNFSNLTDLQDFHIREDCPPLELKHLQRLTSLKNLTIESHHVFVTSENEGDAHCQVPVESLTIRSDHATGKEVSQLLSHLPNLSSLNISSACKKMIPPQQEIVVEVDEEEKVEDGLLLFPAHLSNCLQSLAIADRQELSLVVGAASPPLDHYEAGGLSGQVGGLQALRCLQNLGIYWCPRLLSAYKTSSPSSVSHYFPFPSSLQTLKLAGAMGMGTLEPLLNLTSLAVLEIHSCGEDFRGEGLWTLITHGQLTRLSVYNCPTFFVGSDPSPMRVLRVEGDQEQQCSLKLRDLETDNVAGVLAVPICALLSSSLTDLTFSSDKDVERFTKQQEEALQFLTSLQQLTFSSCHKLQCLPAGLHTLSSLNTIVIFSCPAISSLPKDGLPISLEQLHVLNSDNNEELQKQCRNYVRAHPRINLH